jgi:hypothetical protein
MSQADGAFRTEDMAFATVLIMNGYNPVMERRVNTSSVLWVISAEDWDEGIDELCEDYARGACLVEPRRFMREIGHVRQRMYAYLGVGDKPRGVRIQRAPSA